MSRPIKKLICLAVIVVVFVLFPSFSYNENKADLSTITSVKADPGQVAVDIDYIVDPAGVYYSSGTLASNNILWGQTVGSVDDFGYNASIPANTTLKVQFSRNTYTWYSSAGVLSEYDTLSDGDHLAQVDAISLSELGWAEPYFYYKIVLETTDTSATPVLYDTNIYWTEGSSNTVYVASGTLVSNNILDGQTVAAITSFVYNLSAKPTGTDATIQFSQDNSAWYNSSGVQDGTDTLTTGVDNTIDLSGLGWSGANFYYKISFTSDSTGTPVFDDATVNYLETIDDVYWVGGTGSWSDAENHWALTSGGSPTTLALPSSGTNVHFDSNSGGGTCTLDTAMNIASLTTTSGYTGTVDLGDSSYSHSVSGDVTLDGTAFDMGNSTLTVGGSFDNYDVTTWTRGTGTAVFTGTGSILTKSSANHLTNVAISDGAVITARASGGNKWWEIYGTINIAGSLTTTSSTQLRIQSGGSISLLTGGELSLVSGVVIITPTSSTGIIENSGTWTGTTTIYYSPATSTKALVPGTYIGDVTLAVEHGANYVRLSAGTYNITGTLIFYNIYTADSTLDLSVNNPTVTVGGLTVTLSSTGNAIILPGSGTFTNTGNITNNITGNGTFAVNGLSVILSGTSDQNINGCGATDWGEITINKASGTVTQASNLVTDGITITQGTLDASASNYTITNSGNWSNAVGANGYTARAGTVTLNGTNQTISGNTTFYNLTKSASSADSLTFAAGTTQTITNALTLTGAESNLLSLRSTSAGTQWNMAVPTTRTLQYIDVKDSNNTGTAVDATNVALFTDSGNNTGWTFDTQAPTTSISAVSSTTGASYTFGTESTAPLTITLSCSDSGVGCDYTYYCIDFDNTCNPASSTTQRILYTQPFSPAIDQTYYVRYYSVDTIGNAESVSSALVYSNISNSGSATYGIQQIQTSAQNTANAENTNANIIQQIADTITNTIQQATQTVIQTIFPQTPTQQQTQISYPPIAESVPEEPQQVFISGPIISADQLAKIEILPLPESVKQLALKFPKFAETLESVGIQKPEDIQKLEVAKLSFPGLSESAGVVSNNVGGVLISKFTEQQKQNIPSNVTFVRIGDKNIDLNINVTISKTGDPVQSISTIQSKPLYLVVKPENPVTSIKGYVIFKSSNSQSAFVDFTKTLSASLSASLIEATNFAPNSGVPSGEVIAKKDIVLSEFDYNDNDNDGIWTADINSPVADGKYEIRTVLNYDQSTEEISMIMVVDPEGYIYRKEGKDEARISNATVSIYWLNPETNQYDLWPAKDFQQQNPQVTDNTGKYSFLVPVGKYYLKVESPDYLTYQGEPFEVQEGGGVHQNIQLTIKNWWAKVFTVERIMLGAIIILLLGIFATMIYIILNKKKIN